MTSWQVVHEIVKRNYMSCDRFATLLVNAFYECAKRQFEIRNLHCEFFAIAPKDRQVIYGFSVKHHDHRPGIANAIQPAFVSGKFSWWLNTEKVDTKGLEPATALKNADHVRILSLKVAA